MNESATIMDVNEAAEYLKVVPGTIKSLINAGKLPAFRLGEKKAKGYRIKREALDALFKVQGAI